jgi:putative heme iron utilization protein
MPAESPSDVPTIRPTDGHRLAARRLLRAARAATLATSRDDGGPYASLVTLGTDHDGSPILLLSDLAEHTRHLRRDGRYALLVEEAGDLANPQTGPRATVMGRAAPVAEPATADRLRRRFLASQPGAALYAGFGDFALWRLTVERVHWVGGFARAVWLEDGVTVAAETAHAFAEAEPGILAHMNQDHAAAVEAYAVGLGGRQPGPWRLSGVDNDGIILTCDFGSAAADPTEAEPADPANPGEVCRLSFAPPLGAATEIRSRLVALAAEARR